MSYIIWHYAENQIDNCTKESKKRMNRIISDHLSKLHAGIADPDILALYNRTLPLKTDFSGSYAGAISANAYYKGRTAAYDLLKNELSSTKIEDWDIQIQVVFRKGTPEYIGLLPRGREPFQKGTNDQRIDEVRALGLRLAAYPALAAVKVSVDAFATSFGNARDIQQEKELLVAENSSSNEIHRKALANMMYGNLGVLMDKFRDDPKQIEKYFDLEVIRNTGSETNETIEGPIAGGDSVNLIDGVTDPNTEWLFTNTGITTVIYFMANTPDAVFTDYGQKVNPGETYTKKAIDLGPEGYPYLNVSNMDPDNQGYYSVTAM